MPDIFVDISSSRRLPFVSGVQRVTRELLRRLPAAAPARWRFIAVVHCPNCGAWRRLARSELDGFLAGADASPPSPVATTIGAVNRALLGERGAAGLHRFVRRTWGRCSHDDSLRLPDIPAGSIFLDMDNAWHALFPRRRLLPKLVDRRVTIMNLHYDIIPLLFPAWVHPRTIDVFNPFLQAHFRHSELFICISSSSENDLLDYHAKQEHGRRLNTARIQLGAELASNGGAREESDALPRGRFVLSVGTVEPRKNHVFLIDAFDQVRARHPDLTLVIAGREGWNATRIVRRIREHPAFGKQLVWMDNAGDATLHELYRRAELCVIPSHYEGFGLPVQEALAHGCVTLCSTGGALTEAGQHYALYFEPTDRARLVTLLNECLDSVDCLAQRRAAIANFVAPTWDGSARQLIEVIARQQSTNPALSPASA